MTRNPCHGWADGDPVSNLKADGTLRAVGKVSIFKSKAGRWCCQVRLQTAGTGLGRYGDSVWPEGWTWGQGKYQGRCLECGQQYLTNDPDEAIEEFCPPCVRKEQRARASAGASIRDHVAYAMGARDPQPRRGHTQEELAEIARQKAEDEKRSPF